MDGSGVKSSAFLQQAQGRKRIGRATLCVPDRKSERHHPWRQKARGLLCSATGQFSTETFLTEKPISCSDFETGCSDKMPAGPLPLAHNSAADGSGSEIIQLRKINGSSAETPSYQHLHRELLLSHKRGLLLEEKPELKRVLEQRRLELHKEEEMAQRRPSDLEMELRKRQQKLQEYEQEQIRQRENQNKIPEFVRVRENLRRTQTFEQP